MEETSSSKKQGELLIKSVLSSQTMFSMSLSPFLPQGPIGWRSYLKFSGSQARGRSLVDWDCVCTPIREWGLGIRKLNSF